VCVLWGLDGRGDLAKKVWIVEDALHVRTLAIDLMDTIHNLKVVHLTSTFVVTRILSM
jgi:hypothetical protein